MCKSAQLFAPLLLHTITQVWFQVLCRVLAAISIYSQVATYCWMFVEGVYLHMMVVMAYTYDRFSIKLYMALGWGTPIPITVLWAVLKAVYEDKECWMQNPTDTWVEYFYQIPIFVLFAGFLVCLIYCLSNSEILNAVGRNWRKWRHNTRMPCFEKDLRVRRHSTQSTSPTTHLHVTVKLDRHCDESGTERPEQLPSHQLRSVILHETGAPTLHPAENEW
ncbi:unnamed protein product [Clavelina lepadiformis]|uniref:G-protein coupled receptors family 2 profile 2 domain-containing protein n=1 Tax=Clavelina lepadiformis TaxID=159417 RepID=A0ABP0G6Z2_CLALP